MNKICGLFVILAVLGDFAFCKAVYYPLPNKNQDEGYAGKLFDSFFTSGEGPHETRNDTLITPVSTTTPKPIITTQSVIYYPIIYQEPIYDPGYSPIIPPYPIFYNSPVDSAQLQFDSFGPYYPIVNNIPSVYSNELPPPPVPYLKPSLININTIPELSNPIFPSNAKPNKITKLNPTQIQIPSDQKSENVNDVEIYDKVQDSLNNELNKLLSDFYAKHLYSEQKQEKNESSTKNDTDDAQDEFKDLLLTTESINSVTNRTTSIAKDLVNALGQELTKKLDTDTQSNHDVETDKPSLANESEITNTSQGSVDLNLSGAETTSQNETDDLRKLDLNTEDESSTNVSADKSQSVFTKLEYGQASLDSKLNDSTPEDHVKTRRFFINAEGNECMEEAVIHDGQPYKLFTCAEKNYPGKEIPVKKTTRKMDVTYYTEELSTIAPTTTESTSQHEKNDEMLSSE